MKNFIIYSIETGLISRQCSCPIEMIGIQIKPGEEYIEGSCDCETHVVNGTPVYIPPPPPTIYEVKEIKTKEIKAAFEAAFFLGYTTQGLAENFKVDCRRTDLDNIRGLLEHLEGYPETTQIEFRDFNNTERVITIADLTIIKKELIAYGLWLYQNKWTKEAAIAAAETIEDVEAISW